MDDFEEKLNSILSSPETMGQIMALASSLSAGNGGETAEQPQTVQPPPQQEAENPFAMLQGLDPSMLQRVMRLFRTYNNGNNEKAALLQALRPFLREEKRNTLDKAIQYARYSRVIRAALEEFRGGQNV